MEVHKINHETNKMTSWSIYNTDAMCFEYILQDHLGEIWFGLSKQDYTCTNYLWSDDCLDISIPCQAVTLKKIQL